MSPPLIASFYLDPPLKISAEAGEHNFIAKIASVLERSGFEVEYRENSETERLKSASRPGYSIFHMDDPFHDRAVTIRRNYFYPFWNIESTAKRWAFRVAESVFDAGQVDPQEAARFAGFWRKRLFGVTPDSTEQGFVYVPLQGRLLDWRSFQTSSPFEMLEAVLEHDTERPVVATLHPKETYSQRELDRLEQLADRHLRLRVEMGGMERFLTGCDYVVTQNSSAALAGFFFGKPAALFARIDFHHIAANAHELGPREAIARAPHLSPPFDAYLWWFLQYMSINAGRPEAEGKITAALRRAGWPT